MKHATNNQIIAVAKKFSKVGHDGISMYAIDSEGEKVSFAVTLYRDSLWNLVKDGLLKYNGDYTYSAK